MSSVVHPPVVPQARSGVADAPVDMSRRLATVDVVIPVLNEERALPGCVRTLHTFLTESFPLAWRITIADNGSTDATWQIAQDLVEEFDEVFARRMETRGRGAALKSAWRESPADIVAYMDVDLSTGLGALLPLVAPLISGHSEIAIGTRLAHGARTRRGLKREVVSRGYNGILRYGFGVRFSDAQCGFKAARAEAIRPLLDKVADDHWFFDTELLLLAEYNRFRVHEVPVDWIEDVDSRVRVARTAMDDLKGLARVTVTMSAGRATVKPPKPTALKPTHPDAVLAQPRAVTLAKFATFALIGTFSAIFYALLYLPLRELWSPPLANLGALILAGVCNTEANRRWTFNRRGGHRTGLHLRAAVVFTANYAATTGVVMALHAAYPDVDRVVEVAMLVVAYGLMTVVRFVALDRWVFVRRSRRSRRSW